METIKTCQEIWDFTRKFWKLCNMKKKYIDFSCNQLANLRIYIPRNSPRTPRNIFYLPPSRRNVKLPFLDSSIPRGVKLSEELPSLEGVFIQDLWKENLSFCSCQNLGRGQLPNRFRRPCTGRFGNPSGTPCWKVVVVSWVLLQRSAYSERIKYLLTSQSHS